MKTDLSRDSFDPDNRYTAVVQQQGRVITDADWNEQGDIQNHLRRVLARDTLGASGVPREQPGFGITATTNTSGEPDLEISSGRMYLNGEIAENSRSIFFTTQPHSPGTRLPADDGDYLAYLEIRPRGVSALEQPDLREIALAGVDSSTRTQTISQVKLLALANPATAYRRTDKPPEWLTLANPSRGQLLAQTVAEQNGGDVCAIGGRGGYTGVENNLYRVEIHTGGAPGSATYKWSRTNASFATEWLALNGNTLTVRTTARDVRQRFAPGDWVELDDEGLELEGRPGTFARVVQADDANLTIDPDSLLHQDGAPGPNAPGGRDLNFEEFSRGVRRVRRWDRATESASDSAVLTTPADGTRVELENGIQVIFDNEADRIYHTGDYWLIPARTLSRNILWQCDSNGAPLRTPPRPEVYCARLAFVRRSSGNWTVLADARNFLPQAADGVLYYVGGDGQAVSPGRRLDEPLTVRVAAGNIPLPDAIIRYSITSGDGALEDAADPTNVGTQIQIQSNGQGLAAAHWTAGSDYNTGQNVRAELLDTNGQPTGVFVDFRAHKSFAASTEYTPPDAPDPLNAAATSQSAIDLLNTLKVDRAGDTIDGDLEIKGTLTVRGDVIAKETEQMPGDVLLGDQDDDTVTIHGTLQSEHSSGNLVIQDGLNIQSTNPADTPLQINANVQGVAGRLYRRPLLIDNSANTAPLTDFQTLVIIDTAALIAAGKMEPDGADILFRESGGATSTTLPHWLESGINTTETRIWIRLPALPGRGSHAIDLYYGSPGAQTRSSKSQTFAGEIPGIAVAYSLDEGTGIVANDTAGNNHSGAISGAVWTAGRAGGGQALLFDGNDTLDIKGVAGSSNQLWRGNGLSFAAWVRADQITDNVTGHAIFDNQNSTSAPGLFHRHSIAMLTSGFAFQVNRGDTDGTGNDFGRLVVETTPVVGQWYFLVMTAEDLGSDYVLRGYINGTLAGSKTFTGANLSDYPGTQTATSYSLLGNSNYNLVPFFGALDDVRLYNRALSPVEITSLYDFRSLTTAANSGNELLRKYAIHEPIAGFSGPEVTLSASEQTMLFVESGSGNVGIGTATPGEKLSVAGVIESSEGGIKFPDGTIQTTAGGSSLIAGGANLPLGTIIAWHKNFDGTVPDLPEGWLECNGQTVDDPESPYFGKDLPDLNNAKNAWNSKGSFLRGNTTSGGPLEDDQMQGHRHNDSGHTHTTKGVCVAFWSPGCATLDMGSGTGSYAVNTGYSNLTDPTQSNYGGPRYGGETRPVNMAVVWIIHIRDAGTAGGGTGGLWNPVSGGANFTLGNVGIDESNPQARLHLGGAAGRDGILFPDGTLQTTAAGGSHLPVGTIIAWHKSLTGTPNLPEGWVECNGQTLVDPQSPYNGETMPDLNNPQNSWNDNGSFLRGGAGSGVFEADQFQGHYHQMSPHTATTGSLVGFTDHFKYGHHQDGHVFPNSGWVRDAISDGPNGTPRTGSETRPANMTVVWIIKIRDTAQINAGGYAFLYDRKASGTPGGAANANTWNVRDLNALNTNIPGLALNANRFTLPPGQYTISGDAIGYRTAIHRLQIWNSTDDVAALTGISTNSNTTDFSGISARIAGILTIARHTEFELRHFVQASTEPPFDFGRPAEAGVDECYAQLALLKLTAPGIAPASSTEAAAIQAFAMSAPPAGWLACDGQEVSRDSYPVLFERIGTDYGAGDGSTTFQVPDLRGEFVRGWDNDRGADAGRGIGTAQEDQMQGHGHIFRGSQGQQGTGGPGFTGPNSEGTFTYSGVINEATDDQSNGVPRSGPETRPRNVAMLYCIKY